MRPAARFCLAIAVFAQCGAGLAQTSSNQYAPVVEYEKRQDQESRLQSFGPDLLGDQIDPHTGAITFDHTDVALPGNSKLDVSIRRRRSQGTFYREDVQAEFGDWALLVPRIHVIGGPTLWAGARCSASWGVTLPTYLIGPQGASRSVGPADYSEGVILDVPGAGSQQILWTSDMSAPQYPSGTLHATTENWRLLCNVTASDGGEGFTAIALNGDQYRFDRFISRPGKVMGTVGGAGQLDRNRNILAATRVTDVNGNTVDYTYDASGRLTQISSNDGRTIVLSYQGASQLIYQVTANGRTWTYSYAPSTYAIPFEIDPNLPSQAAILRTVTLPNGTAWSFNLDTMAAPPGPGELCHSGAGTITVTHPNGAQGSFHIAQQVHRQSEGLLVEYAKHCPFSDFTQGVLPSLPLYTYATFKSMAVTSKTITSPNAPTATWTYDYENDDGSGSAGSAGTPDYHTNWTTVQEPNGRHLTYYHYWNAEFGVQADLYFTPLPPGNPLGGKLAALAVREGGSTGALLETMTYSYFLEKTIGSTFARTGTQSFAMINPARTYETAINRLGDTYSTRNTFVTDFASSTYSFGFSTHVDEWSSTSGGWNGRRYTDTVYAHNKTKWVLGLPSTVTRNGKLFDSYTYDTLGRVATKSEFGAVKRTFTYHTASGQQGAINTIADSHGHVWTLSNWKRGKPQSILYPNADTFSRVVDNNGWVTSETNGRAIVTGFNYNNMGWLTSVDIPAPFNDVTVSYSGLSTGVQEARTLGAKKTTISYDGYLRPWLVKTEATDGSATTNYVKTSYDGLGRTIFQSWPSSSSSPTAGVNSQYDALSRVTSVAETVSPYAATRTAYLSGGQVRVTDPANAIVTTTNRAFGDPNEAEAMQVVDALSATTTMTRDIYGNVSNLSQSGTQNGFSTSVTRTFTYDDELRLKIHIAPEFQAFRYFTYDSEGLLISSGFAHTLNKSSDPTSPFGVANRGYDERHRETSVTFPAGTPGITRTYDANGNVTNVTRAGGAVWDYTYTALDQIATETLAIDGRSYVIGHGYTTNGDLATRSNSHSGVNFSFDANAYGQPRSVKNAGVNYVTSAVYHPNGVLSAANYLNGHSLSQSLDGRQKPWVLKTAKPGGETAVWLTHTYEVRGKIDQITDSDGAGSDEGRNFVYDPSGRLVTANGPWGSGSYVYDALGNMRVRTEGSNSVSTMNYDATNRVSSATIFGQNRTFAYDARGNVANNGKYAFVYDDANQPVSQTGATSSTFAYDGNLKRVKEVRSGKTIYTVYSRVTGGLVYRDEATDNVKTDYAQAGGAALRLKKTGTGPFVPEYTHFDTQGSAVAATDASGAVVWRESYRPFGRPRLDPPANADNTGYTGHLVDKSTGLVYMQARYYDPLIGRFYSTDPIGYQDQLNLYAYVANDPVNLTDPTGECSTGSRLPGGGDSSGCKVEFDFARSQRGSEERKQPQTTSESSQNSGEDFFRTISGGRAGSAEEYVAGVAEELLGGLADGALGGPEVGATFKAGAGIFGIAKTVSNANKLNHIFGQARHNLGPLVQKFGSQQSAFSAVESSIQAKVAKEGLTGVFKTSVSVGGQSVEVRGKVIDGVAQIGTFYIPK